MDLARAHRRAARKKGSVYENAWNIDVKSLPRSQALIKKI